MVFPQYRKYSNNKSFFKIHSNEEFEELKIIGSNFNLKFYKATIHPDRVFITDMLEAKDGHWILCTENEFQEQLNRCRQALKEIH